MGDSTERHRACESAATPLWRWDRVPDRGAKQTFRACLQLELVSDEGYITKEGRELLARCDL